MGRGQQGCEKEQVVREEENQECGVLEAKGRKCFQEKGAMNRFRSPRQ